MNPPLYPDSVSKTNRIMTISSELNFSQFRALQLSLNLRCLPRNADFSINFFTVVAEHKALPASHHKVNQFHSI